MFAAAITVYPGLRQALSYADLVVSRVLTVCVSAAIMFAFQDNAAVKKVINALPRVGIGVKYGLPQTRYIQLSLPLYILHNIPWFLAA